MDILSRLKAQAYATSRDDLESLYVDAVAEIEGLRGALSDLLPYAETCVPNPVSVGEENVISKAKRLLGRTHN
jgi:hypothetical protein